MESFILFHTNNNIDQGNIDQRNGFDLWMFEMQVRDLGGPFARRYDVMPDGQRFVQQSIGHGSWSALTVLVN
jgi:hypothetical protein